MKPNKDPRQPDAETTYFAREGSLPVTSELRDEFLRFMDFHSARRFRRNLRKMLLEFMMYEGALEAIYLKDLIYDLDGLFDLLDAIHEVQEKFEES